MEWPSTKTTTQRGVGYRLGSCSFVFRQSFRPEWPGDGKSSWRSPFHFPRRPPIFPRRPSIFPRRPSISPRRPVFFLHLPPFSLQTALLMNIEALRLSAVFLCRHASGSVMAARWVVLVVMGVPEGPSQETKRSHPPILQQGLDVTRSGQMASSALQKKATASNRQCVTQNIAPSTKRQHAAAPKTGIIILHGGIQAQRPS